MASDPIEGWERFYAVVRRIPRGRVLTYAGVAALAGNPRLARHVGFALAALRDERNARDVPWQRVLGSRGRGHAGVSIKDPIGGGLQRTLLESEGVAFDDRGRVALERFEYRPAPNATLRISVRKKNARLVSKSKRQARDVRKKP